MSAVSVRARLGLALGAGAVPLLLLGYSGGPPVRRTGAPGDRSCLDANCHVGERFEDSPGLTLDTGTGFTYTPGGPPRRWTIRIVDPLARAFGVQLSVRRAADPARSAAGELAPVDPANSTVLCEDNQPRSSGPCRSEAPVQFFLHTEPRRTAEFALQWTPPLSDLGDVEVYVAANASVAGQRSSRIHLRKFRLSSTNAPAAATLVNAASADAAIADGSWISVHGTGLAPSTRGWSTADVRDGALPTSLDGVELQINGRPASIAFVSPTQINALAPADESVGSVPFTVLRDGQVTATGAAIRSALAPALWEEPGSEPRRAAATFPGDGRVILYGTGFGPTVPHGSSGGAVLAPAPLDTPVTFLAGGQQPTVEWAGLISPGLYQFNLLLPALPAGDHSLMAEIRGAVTQRGLTLRIP